MIRTRLTELLNIDHPVISAPMAGAGGGALAAAVSEAGGLGLIGGGYGMPDWIDQQFEIAGNRLVGAGIITWRLNDNPDVLDHILAHQPKAMMLSFDDPRPWAAKVHAAGARLICQVQDVEGAKMAVDAGADVIVAQGTAAGGHGATRSTITLVPEVADLLANRAPGIVPVAAGGIGDGRGLAAALSLGAEGVLMGSRFWATSDALVADGLQQKSVAATGDQTLATSVVDIVRGFDWPEKYKLRVLDTGFVSDWHGREDVMRQATAESNAMANAYQQALDAGDPAGAAVIVGEATGLINDIPDAATVMARIVAEAEKILAAQASRIA